MGISYALKRKIKKIEGNAGMRATIKKYSLTNDPHIQIYKCVRTLGTKITLKRLAIAGSFRPYRIRKHLQADISLKKSASKLFTLCTDFIYLLRVAMVYISYLW